MEKGRGYLLMIGATLALAGVVLFVGMTEGKVPVENLLVVRGLVFLTFLGPWALRNRGQAKGGNRKLLLGRGLFGVATQTGTIMAATRIPISIASLLQKTAPLWTFFLAWILFKVRPLAIEVLALPFAAVGLWLLAQPGHALDAGSASGIGIAAGFAGGFFNALEIISMRHLRSTDSPNAINLWYAGVTTVAAFPFCFDGGWPSSPKLWGCAVMYSLCALVGQSLLAGATRSLTSVETSIGTMMKPVFAAVLGWFFMSQDLTGQEMLGMLIVLVAAGTASVAERYRPKAKEPGKPDSSEEKDDSGP